MSKITKGCYVETSEIKDTEQWKKVIDAFVEAGYDEYEGYSSGPTNHVHIWNDHRYVGIDCDGDTMHFYCATSYGSYPTKMSVSEVLGELTPKTSFRIEKNLSDMADQSKIETLESICSEGWKLGGIEPNGDYIFYREK